MIEEEKTHNIDVDAVKAVLWQCEFVKWSNGVMVNFGKLTGSAGTYPSSYIFLNAMPHKALYNELLHRLTYGCAK